MTVIVDPETFFSGFCTSNRSCPLRKLGVSELVLKQLLGNFVKTFFFFPSILCRLLPNLGAANVRDFKMRATDFDGNWSVFWLWWETSP